MTHELKVWGRFFDALSDGRKPFEIRNNDRNYRVGDVLVLRETHGDTAEYTGRSCTRRVSYLTDFQQRDGFIVMGLEPLTQADPQSAGASQ